MRSLFSPPVVRLGIRPEKIDPFAILGPRPRGSRRPHTDATVAAVRRLVEQSVLSYRQIAAKIGINDATVCRWTQIGGWQRPLFAPRSSDLVPRERAGARLRLRTLAARLAALAERAIRELEASAPVDLDRLAEALELVKMAKLATLGRRRRRAGPVIDAPQIFDAGPREVMRGLRAAGVRVERAPEDALEDFIASRAPPPKRLTRRQREHAWMLEREGADAVK